MKCLNTACDNPAATGTVIGLHREFCEQCEIEAQERVAASRAAQSATAQESES